MKKNGFTIFFATLVASLSLTIGLAIYDVVSRQLTLSTTVAQSQYAIYAADSGVQCALYWDSKYGGSGSAFMDVSPSSGIICGSYDMAAKGTPPVPFAAQPTGWTPWSSVFSAGATTTTFTLTFPGYSYCAVVQVVKTDLPSGAVQTTVFSRGYNTCVAGPVQLERELKVSY